MTKTTSFAWVGGEAPFKRGREPHHLALERADDAPVVHPLPIVQYGRPAAIAEGRIQRAAAHGTIVGSKKESHPLLALEGRAACQRRCGDRQR